MIVVSDSSPLNFLICLRRESILPALFGTVPIPPKVQEELSRDSTPAEVRAFVAARPAWLVVRSPARIERLARLDAGEEAAISLAREVRAELVLLDDGDARKAAAAMGLAEIGLIGILERADEAGLLDFRAVAGQMPADYRIDRGIVEAAVERRRQRSAIPG